MFASNRRNAGVIIGDVTMGVDHYAVQGALAVALPALAVLAACWPRGRRFLGIAVGLSAGYLGLVSFAFPATWAGLPPLGSALCMAWGAAVAVLALAAPRLQPRELRREVVETQ
jgi:peptidoglycan/LPS O-acetylase OafA/YrhL